ncbi:MAG: metallophosphoesterase [Ignavibacteriales bacterium]|nr:metallophosphoesterase [Ignavibacteriales bacterium]
MPWTLVAVLVISLPLAAINYFVGKGIFGALVQLTTWNRGHLKRAIVGIHVFLNALPAAFFVAFLVMGRRSVPAFSGDSIFLDILLSYPFWIGLVVMFQLMILFALLAIIGSSLVRLVPSLANWWIRRKPVAVIGMTALVSVYSLVVIVRDTWTVRIVHQEIALPAALKNLTGFRIAAISDVQGDGRTTKNDLQRYVGRVNSLNPDLVLFGGDLVTSGTRYIESTARIMAGLKSRFGTFAAVGDHDLFSDKSMVVEALTRAGVNVIEDSTVTIDSDSCRIALSVFTYTYLKKPERKRLEGNSSEKRGEYRIMLAHQPAEELVDLATRNGFNLMVAGHTHGGGIAFGVPGLFLLAPAQLESRFVSGLFLLGSMNLIVTNGLGLTLAPIRFHALAEIVLITLR